MSDDTKRVSTHECFSGGLNRLDESTKRERLAAQLAAIKAEFQQLNEEVKWNQPLFTHHGTFIIGFSVAKGHVAIAPEAGALDHFARETEEAGYTHSKELFRIAWADPVNYPLLHKLTACEIAEKEGSTSFWQP